MAVTELTSENFDAEIGSAALALVDFFADWCGPCQMQAPVLEELAGERTDVKFCKVNVDSQEALAAKYGISSIPALLIFKKGVPAKNVIGFHGREELAEILQSVSE